jgi:hypothetical protein
MLPPAAAAAAEVEWRQPSPYVDIEIDIEVPAPGAGLSELAASDAPFDLDTAALRRELEKPHSLIRMRLKDVMEKAVAQQALRNVPPPPEAKPIEDPTPPRELTIAGTLGLRERPRETGGAYMMRGPTAEEACFAGGHLFNFTGTEEVNTRWVSHPPAYRPFRDEHEQPYGRTAPTAENPVGERIPPPPFGERNAFSLVQARASS